jgi:hypothetical protein
MENNITKLNIRPGSTGIIARAFLFLAQRLQAIMKPEMAGPPIIAVINNCFGL